MTTSSRERAEQIVKAWFCNDGVQENPLKGGVYDPEKAWEPVGRASYSELISAIAAALEVPEGCVRDDKGVDRKVLGILPVTADGLVVGEPTDVSTGTHPVFDSDGRPNHLARWVSGVDCDDPDCVNCPHWQGAKWMFSTREAALAARQGGANG